MLVMFISYLMLINTTFIDIIDTIVLVLELIQLYQHYHKIT